MDDDGPTATRPARIGVRHVVVIVALLVAIVGLSAACSPDAPTPTGSTTELTEDKLAEEVRKLRFETDRAASGLGVALAVGPFVTVMIAVLTFGAAIWKQGYDRAKDLRTRADQLVKDRQSREDQQTKDRQQLEKDRQSREDQQTKDRQQRDDQQTKDRQLRFDTQFSTAATQVAAADEGLQAAGAASLLRLQDSADAQMQNEIVLYCATQLRIGTSPKVRPIIKEVLAAALRRITSACVENPRRLKTLNLEDADLSEIDLNGLDLRNVRLDLSGADLSGANLRDADLWSVRAPGARLEGANCEGTNFGPAKLGGADLRRARLGGARLASADLRRCDLSGASLRGAELQSAHFEWAVLNPTDFAYADVNDAYFTSARLTSITLTTLAKARNRDKCHGLPVVGHTVDVNASSSSH